MMSFLWSMGGVSIVWFIGGVLALINGPLVFAAICFLFSAAFARFYFRDRKGLGS
jgi:hypothetical protein